MENPFRRRQSELSRHAGTAEIVRLPHPTSEVNIVDEIVKHFDPRWLEYNLQILHNDDGSAFLERMKFNNRKIQQEARAEYERYLRSRDQIFATYQQYANDIRHFSQIPRASDLLPYLSRERSIRDLKDINRLAQLVINNRSGQFVFVADSHSSTYAILKSLPKKPRGIIIVDRHTDYYGKNQKKGEEPSKANFLKNLLDNRDIQAITILGVATEWVNRLQHGKDDEPAIKTFRKNKRRISIVSDNRIASSSQAKIEDLIAEQVEFQRNLGVEELYISLDLDGLDVVGSGLTATEYNPFTPVLALGVQNLNKWDFQGNPYMESYYRSRSLRYIATPLPQADHLFDAKLPNLEGTGVPLTSAGFMLETILDIAPQRGLMVGSPTPYGGIVRGDIVEYCGFDVGRRTYDAIQYLGKILTSSPSHSR